MRNFPINGMMPNNPAISALLNLKNMGSSDFVFNQMYNTNPAFKQFADQMKGVSPEQAFKQNGLDFNQFKNLKW